MQEVQNMVCFIYGMCYINAFILLMEKNTCLYSWHSADTLRDGACLDAS